MRAATIYAIVFSRIIILLLGFILLPFAFALFVVAQIGQLYLAAFFAFTTRTKAIIDQFTNGT